MLLRCRQLHPAVTNLTVHPDVHLQVFTCGEEAKVSSRAQTPVEQQARRYATLTGLHPCKDAATLSRLKPAVSQAQAYLSSDWLPLLPGQRCAAAPPAGCSVLCTCQQTAEQPAALRPSPLRPAGHTHASVPTPDL